MRRGIERHTLGVGVKNRVVRVGRSAQEFKFLGKERGFAEVGIVVANEEREPEAEGEGGGRRGEG